MLVADGKEWLTVGPSISLLVLLMLLVLVLMLVLILLLERCPSLNL